MQNQLNFSIELARRAGQLLLDQFYNSQVQTHLKFDRSVVTEADFAADHLISDAIREHFPDDQLLSEELQPNQPIGGTNAAEESSRPIWVVDPLDGTTNFSLGLHFWGVLIARLVNGFPETGVLYFPVIDEMYTAQRGQGAYLNGERIEVKLPNPDQPAAFFTCCSRTFRRYTVNIPYKARILGSAAYSLCSVARGIALLGFEATPKIWDIAAGWLLVQEAGGTIETFDGSQPFPLKPGLDFARQNYPTLAAATPTLAKQAFRQIQPK